MYSSGPRFLAVLSTDLDCLHVKLCGMFHLDTDCVYHMSLRLRLINEMSIHWMRFWNGIVPLCPTTVSN